MAITWKASNCQYKYLNRDPDPLVQPVRVDWGCTADDGTNEWTEPGSTEIHAVTPTFAESQIVRVTESVLVGWTHDAMRPGEKDAVEQRANDGLASIGLPDYGNTPPDTGP